MQNYVRLEDPVRIEERREEYLSELIAPMDGMWESVVIGQAEFWEIQEDGQYAGYFCLDAADHALVRFHVVERYRMQAQEMLRRVVEARNIQYAIASTVEPGYFSLCLDIQTHVEPHSYLFRADEQVNVQSGPEMQSFRMADESERAFIVQFYHKNAEGAGEWIESFVRTRLKRGELFVLYHEDTLLVTGECIASQRQPSYADLGMIVARAYRGRGLGSAMLRRLKLYCDAQGWRPICSCAVDNYASKKAIEKAGFVSEHRMVRMGLRRN